MKLISHRGNIIGKETDKENSPSYIDCAINEGFEVEVDVWLVEGKFVLGHDYPQYEVKIEWLNSRPLWCHAKNIQSMTEMMKSGLHCFWHESDKYTITSRGVVWCFPGNHCPNGITVNLESVSTKIESPCLGICTDIPLIWRENGY